MIAGNRMQTANLAVVTHPRFLERGILHDGAPDTDAFSAARLRLVVDALTAALPVAARIEPRAATRREVEQIHCPDYLDMVAGYSSGLLARDHYRYLGPTVPVFSNTYDLALLGAGAVIEAIDLIERGCARRGIVAARPACHHAYAARGDGFGVVNHTAVGARHWQRAHGRRTIAIVDVDVHHGNGTQSIFYSDPTVFTFSIHSCGRVYPRTGDAAEQGEGPGQGYNRNVPLESGTRDGPYLRALAQGLRSIPVRPDAVMLVMGFDTHRDDPLGDLRLSEAAFRDITMLVMDYADRECDGRMVSVLAGGYNHATIGELTALHAETLAG